MALFGSRRGSSARGQAAEVAEPEKPRTPKRSELVKQQHRPLVPADAKEAKRQARQQVAAQRQRVQEGYARGDEQFLPERDKGPAKKFARDYVDSRFSVGQLMIPMMLVILFLTFLNSPEMLRLSYVLLWTFVALVVLDCIAFTWFMRRKARAKLGPGKEKGISWYAAMRATQMRFMRMPKPQVRIGEKID